MTVREYYHFHSSSTYTYFMLCSRWGSSRDATRAFAYLFGIIVLQLSLLRLYGIAADRESENNGPVRAVFGEIDEAALYTSAYRLAMNATGLLPSDLGGAENATLLRANLLEYRAFLKGEAAPLALHWRHIGVTLASHWRYIGFTLALHWRYIGVILALHSRHTDVTFASH